MKKIILLLLAAASIAAHGQSPDQIRNQRIYEASLQQQQLERDTIAAEMAAEAADEARQRAIALRAMAIKTTIETFPWRTIDGVTQHVAVTWCYFTGKVLQTCDEGIRIEGEYHPIYPAGQPVFQGDFFVKHFPYALADGDPIPEYLAAMPAGIYSYTSVQNAQLTLHCLDFGIPCDAPDWATQPAAQPAPIADEKKAALARELAADEKLAAQGDDLGLLHMAERYRDGNGVKTNVDMARDYFIKAEQAGSPTASNELAALTIK